MTDRAAVSDGWPVMKPPGGPGHRKPGRPARWRRYLPAIPYAQPVTGLDVIRQIWQDEREGPDAVFTLTAGVLAVDGQTAMVPAGMRYGDPPRREYRDLWIIRLGDDGRAAGSRSGRSGLTAPAPADHQPEDLCCETMRMLAGVR